jgi:hypothetical protein
MVSSGNAIVGRRAVTPYVVLCVGMEGRQFRFEGIFASDWDAIDSALDQGALFALPQRSDRCLAPSRAE